MEALVSALVLTGAGLVLTGRRFHFVLLLLGVLLLQNVTLMVLLKSGVLSEDGARVLTATKELLLIAGLSSLAAPRVARTILTGRMRRAMIPSLILLWFIFVGIHALMFGAPWIARVAGARGVLLLPALYLLGYWLSLSWRDISRFFRTLVVIAVCMAAFGYIEAYALPESFWLNIGHEEFYQQKIGRPIQNTLYGNMRYWFNGQPIRRVASITGDPLISSYPMALVIVMTFAYFIYRGRLRLLHPLLLAVVGIATLLTLSRGAALTVLLAAGLMLIGRRSSSALTGATTMILLAMVIMTVAFGDAILTITTGAGHVDQLVDGLRRGIERPLGYGLGTASSLATGVARSSDVGGIVLGGGDSYMGSLATQMGLPAVVMFYGLMLLMIGELAQHSVSFAKAGRPNAWLFGAVAAMLAGLLVTSAVNESGFGFVASGATYILAGSLARLGLADRWRIPRLEAVVPQATEGGALGRVSIRDA